MQLAIRGGRVVDGSGERRLDVGINDGQVVALDVAVEGADQEIDATGCVVGPGLVDMHTHLRQPGNEEAETIETGSRAAVLGGFTAVLAMPNTTPAIDCAAVVREVQELGRLSLCDIEVAAAITVGRAGEQLSPIAELAGLGVRIFTDDGAGVQDARLMRRALEYGTAFNVVLAQHCEVDALSEGGHMNEGEVSSRLGVPGIPDEAEELMISRDVALGRMTGARVHFQHVSTAGSVDLVRAAKASGVHVTAEATPHHFTLTDQCCSDYDPLFKVNPPLRTATDVAAIKAGLADGTIDAIATDHAPCTPESKDMAFDQAPAGVLGLETALALALTELQLPVEQVLGLLSWKPAAILGLGDRHGAIGVGRPANICVFDPTESWTVDPTHLASISRNTPFGDRPVNGRIRHTVASGELVVTDGEVQR